ncbi:NSNH, partial [Symbiodinium necroappetens]
VDDAIAICMALQLAERSNFELKLITTCFGNCSLEQVTVNVAKCLAAVKPAQRPLVANGAAHCLAGTAIDASHFHGHDGLGDAQTPEPPAELLPGTGAPGAVAELLALAQRARHEGADLILVTLGPLTNLALALRENPKLPEMLTEVFVMGCCGNGRGNHGRVTEFNVHADPEAAAEVFAASWERLTVASWELTVLATVPWPRFDRLLASNSEVGKFLAAIAHLPYVRDPSKIERGGLALLRVFLFRAARKDIGEVVQRDPICSSRKMISSNSAGSGEVEDEGTTERAGAPLTLALLQQALQVNQQQITDSIQESIAGIGHRVAQVEANMGEHVKRTTELLDAMTDRHVHIEQTVNRVASGHAELSRRLELLEGKFATATFSTTSTTRTDGSTDSNPRPAIVVGGWDNDQGGDETLRLVKQHLEDLQCNLDLQDAFVPGIRRGFAIVPIAPRPQEDVPDYRRRIREALQKIREAKIITGEKPQGGERYLWAAMSESPERRKRAQFAGKIKRLVLEESGDRSQLEVEFGTGNVWYGRVRVASAVLTAPEEADKAGVGWVSLPTLARQMGTSLSSLTTKWDELKKILTWNVGGLSPDKALQLLEDLRKERIHPFSDPFVVLLQEVIVDEGKLNFEKGELMLEFLDKLHMKFPFQEIDQASYFPYNQNMQERRLDYICTRRLLADTGEVLPYRDLARSDHEAIVVPVLTEIPKAKPSPPKTWGTRRLKAPTKVAEMLATYEITATDPVQLIANIARQITVPGKQIDIFRESKHTKRLRHRILQMAPGDERKQMWKMLAKQRREEHRTWQAQKLTQAGKAHWREKQAVDNEKHNNAWELRLRSDDRWRETLVKHFGGIFDKSDSAMVDLRFAVILHRMTGRCKFARWQPFTEEELKAVRKRWKNGKACGPDSISHEALKVLEQDDYWRGQLLHVFNDMLYTAKIPANIENGVTVLLAKIPSPGDWSDTRPITLSSTLLRSFSQLIIGRASHCVL